MPKLTPEAEQQLQDLLVIPSGFAEMFLQLPVYDWQAEVLNWYADPRRTTMGCVCTPNGAGKSSGIVAALSLWWLTIYPKGKVVITSASNLQIEQQLYPALERHRARFKDWKWVTSPYIEITTPTGGKLIANTTNDPGKAEGHHPTEKGENALFDSPVLMIVDEAKSVPEEIFMAIDRCSYSGLLYVSSPGMEEGRFYKASKSPMFRKRMVSLKECPHISPDKINRIIGEYGENHPFTRSAIYGEFMREGDVPYVFPKHATRRAFEFPSPPKPGAVTLFCDFAAGGDENVIAMRNGNILSIAAHWRDKDTTMACATFALHFKRLGVKAHQVFGDNGGIGKSMIQMLANLGWEINPVDNQTKPFDRNYTNRGAEMWHETAAAMRRADLCFDEDLRRDELFFEQLTSRRAEWSEKATRLGVEDKKMMKNRGVSSPDRADAVCGAWFCGSIVPQEIQTTAWEHWRQENELEYAVPEGMDAGL